MSREPVVVTTVIAAIRSRSATTVGAVLLVIGPLAGCAATDAPVLTANSSAAPASSCGSGGMSTYARTELYFGKSIPGGGSVTDAEFAAFLDREVTPRFPAGFTVVPAMGQFREANGVIDHEASDLVIFFYPRDSVQDSGRKLDEIRAAYDKTFRQESVLRTDEQPTCVSF